MAFPLIDDEVLQAAKLNQNGLMGNWMRQTSEAINTIGPAVETELAALSLEIDAVQLEVDTLESVINNFAALNINTLANIGFVPTINAGVLTVTMTGNNEQPLSANNAATIPFRSATLLTSTMARVNVSSPISVSTVVGAALGTYNNNAPFRLWVVALLDGANVRLGLFQSTIGTTSAPQGVMPLPEEILWSTTAFSAAANSPGVIYTNVGIALANAPMRILGYMDWATGLILNGTYATLPTQCQQYAPGIKKPGDIIQQRFAFTNTNYATTSFIPGIVMTNITVGFTKNAAPNMCRIMWATTIGQSPNIASGLAIRPTISWRRGGGSTLGSTWGALDSNAFVFPISGFYFDPRHSTRAVTYEIMIGSSEALPNTTATSPTSGNIAQQMVDEIMA